MQVHPQRSPGHIITFVQDLDGILGGGVRVGEVTEISGPAGTGKTQLVLQLLLDVQIPINMGGCAGEAVLIDTEGSFYPSRIQEMARAVHTHLARIARRRPELAADEALAEEIRTACSPEGLLQHIHVFRAKELQAQQSALRALPSFLRSHPNVRLVAVDSIAFHHRYGAWSVQDPVTRHRQLQILAAQLNRIAAEFNVAVVVTNQMTTRLGETSAGANAGGFAGGSAVVPRRDPAAEEPRARVTPALGDVWAHTASTRLQLRWDTRPGSLHAGQRVAFVPKCVQVHGDGNAHFRVCADGIRGLGVATSSLSSSRAAKGGSGAGETPAGGGAGGSRAGKGSGEGGAGAGAGAGARGGRA
jgi:RAD51-like protein 2